MRSRTASLLTAGVLVLAPFAAGCSSDTKDNAKDAVESAGDDLDTGTDKLTARATAEAFRASLKGNDTADEKGLRNVDALQEVADDLPGDPDITGIDDGDGDGLDDDGKVQVTVDDEEACIIIPEEGTDTSVEEGAC